MCLGIPMQVIEVHETYALCEGRNGRQVINTMLVDRVEVGQWLMTFLDAGRLGKLSLSVRAADGSGDNPAAAASSVGSGDSSAIPEANTTQLPTTPAPTGGVTWAGDVSPALGGGGPRKTPPTVHIFQGGLDSKEFHF